MKRFALLFAVSFFANALIAQNKTTVYFDSNKSQLKQDAIKVLDSIALLSSDNRILSINGYCDNIGDDNSNQTLSEKRANAVAHYLKKKGARIGFWDASSVIKGFGETSPVASNDDETGKAKNRRVEIILVKGNSPERLEQGSPIVVNVPEPKETFNEKSTLDNLEVGKTMVLKNLNFEGGTAVLLPEGKPTLEMLLKTMQENPSLVIEIGGHVCCKDDMPLSIMRAQSVYNYLVKNGISKDRMTYKGYSRSKPIFEDDSDEYHARLNRRVEITVLKK